MANLLLKVKNQSLEVVSDIERIVENSINYLSVSHKILTDDWKDLATKYLINYEGEVFECNGGFIPRELIKAPGFKISIVGFEVIENILTQKITTSPVFVNVYPSGKTDGKRLTDEQIAATMSEALQQQIQTAEARASGAYEWVTKTTPLVDAAVTKASSALELATDAAATAATAMSIAETIQTSITGDGGILERLDALETTDYTSSFNGEITRLDGKIDNLNLTTSGSISKITTRQDNLEREVSDFITESSSSYKALNENLATLGSDIRDNYVSKIYLHEQIELLRNDIDSIINIVGGE